MLSPSLTNQLVEAHVAELHRAARNDGRHRRLWALASETDRSPAPGLAARVTRALSRVLNNGRSADGEATAIYGFELAGARSTATWSRRP